MKKLIPFIAGILMLAGLHAQVPVPMASQPSLTYTENFSDIASWTNNFVSGSGANRFTSVAPGGATAIPSATRIRECKVDCVNRILEVTSVFKYNQKLMED